MILYYCEKTGSIFHMCPDYNLKYYNYSSVYEKREKVFYCEKCRTSVPFALTFGLTIHRLHDQYKIGDYPIFVDDAWVNKYSKFHLINET